MQHNTGEGVGLSMSGTTQLLYTRTEAAELLKISLSHLDNEAKRGKIRRVTFGSGRNVRVRYRHVDLEAYIQDHLSACLT